ncbi:hypothetical protein [Thiothrix sp.]|jgi:hypothetical protein|uniref:hypothetical protein n=1 Tax=Thiothrix sp. TaxID=1032 RepID=UPI00257E73DD|nr:hypothetical protein [Thiothrix sp.]
MSAKPEIQWMSETSVARHFGFRNPCNIEGWGIPHLRVTTAKGRVVRRYKKSDVLNFEQSNFKKVD